MEMKIMNEELKAVNNNLNNNNKHQGKWRWRLYIKNWGLQIIINIIIVENGDEDYE